MKKITFPGPEHEKAMAIMEQAQKDLEALGYIAGFAQKLHGEADDQNKTGIVYVEVLLTANKIL
jgi:tRNA(Met) C34 N-acetyltransferase TmcA